MKSQKSATRQALQDMSMRWLLMLSGTPVQNNMRELQVGVWVCGCGSWKQRRLPHVA